MIKVKYSSVDGVRTLRSFSSLRAAQAFAKQCVGRHPDIGSTYAVSADGVGKVEVFGDAKLADLFGERVPRNDDGGQSMDEAAATNFGLTADDLGEGE